MTLSFQTKWGKGMGELAGMPNYFVEKIWKSISDMDFRLVDKKFGRYFFNPYYNFLHIADKSPKLHTIREDASERWREGMDIHFVINNRTKDRFQFAPVVKCAGVQEITISYYRKTVIDNYHDYTSISDDIIALAWIDGRILSHNDVAKVAQNDGFNSVDDFFNFFNKPFKGKIIHWTDLKY